ncbi:hypothetical protein ACS0TY_016067 [Phlomoides rotata]
MSLLPIFKNNHVLDPFTMDIWDPFKDNHHHHHLWAFHNHPAPFGGGAKAEWSETAEAHMLRVDVPGLKREEVKVKVREGKVVKISGKKKVEREEKHENWQHFERSEGKFMRVFTLPENSRGDHVKSSLENGVLTITIPKRDVKKGHDIVKNIQVKG